MTDATTESLKQVHATLEQARQAAASAKAAAQKGPESTLAARERELDVARARLEGARQVADQAASRKRSADPTDEKAFTKSIQAHADASDRLEAFVEREASASAAVDRARMQLQEATRAADLEFDRAMLDSLKHALGQLDSSLQAQCRKSLEEITHTLRSCSTLFAEADERHSRVEGGDSFRFAWRKSSSLVDEKGASRSRALLAAVGQVLDDLDAAARPRERDPAVDLNTVAQERYVERLIQEARDRETEAARDAQRKADRELSTSVALPSTEAAIIGERIARVSGVPKKLHHAD